MTVSDGALWVLAATGPIVLAGALMLAGLLPAGAATASRAGLVRLAPLVVLPAVALAVLAPPPARVDWLLLGTHVSVDEIARPMLLVAALLYGLALAAICWNRERASSALAGFLLISFGGNVGTYLAADVVTFYLSFAMMSFCAFVLVIHYRTAEARRAARVYLVMSVASETAVLAALILIGATGARMVAQVPEAVAASPHRDVIIALLLLGFAVKAGTVPLHIWLPLAHPAAPPAASAVLSGAMVKAGMIGMIRFLPLGAVALPQWGTGLVVLALVGAFLAVPIGALQADPKVVLAYSTISQMGFVVAVSGVGLAHPALAPAAALAVVVYAVAHGLVKGALFLGVSVWKHHRGRLVGVLMVVAALALAGAPLTAGALGKYAAKGAVGDVTFIGAPLDVVLSLVATGSTLLMLRLARLLWRSEPEPNPGEHSQRGELWAWVALVLSAATVPWLVALWWVPQTARPSPNPLEWGDSLWPIALGVLAGAALWWMSRQDVLPDWVAHPDGSAIPPGDLVVPEEAQLARVGVALRAGLDRLHELGRAAGAEASSAASRFGRFVVAGTVAREDRLTQERSSGVALLVVLSIVLILVALIQEGLS